MPPVSFDELLRRVWTRIEDYQRTGDPGAVLDDLALAESAGLWNAAQPSDAVNRTLEENHRLAVASHAVGWLSFARNTALPEPSNLVELARAILLLGPLAENPDAIPEPLHSVLGPNADPYQQASLAAGLLQAVGAAELHVLDAAIGLQSTALVAIPAADSDRMMLLTNLGIARFWRFERVGELADLDAAIASFGQAIAAAPNGHPEPTRLLDSLGSAYARRFAHAQAMEDADRAAELLRKAVAATPTSARERADHLAKLGSLYLQRYERTEQAEDLEQAIESWGQAVAATPDDAPERATRLSRFGTAVFRRYERAATEADLERAIELAEQAVAATPAGDPSHAERLADLGFGRLRRFGHTSAATDLDQGIDALRRALAALPADHPVQVTALSDLAGAHALRFQHTAMPADVDHAIELGEQAATLVPPGHPHRVAVLSNLGGAYKLRFDTTEVPADLDQAITLFEQAVAATPAAHPDRAMSLARLGTACRKRFDRIGRVEDLDQAMDAGERALATVSADHPLQAGLLEHLVYTYRQRFERTKAPSDVDRAIELGERLLLTTPVDDPQRPANASDTGAAYMRRFELVGALTDVDRAIELGEQAHDTAPSGHPRRPVILTNLAISHLARYERTGLSADLGRAIELGEQALAADPPGDTMRLTNLSLSYLRRFERFGALVDLDRAIELGEQGRDVTSADAPVRTACLTNLSLAYRLRFERLGALADVDRAIELGELVTTPGSASDIDHAQYLSNLSFAYVRRFERTSVLTDVDRAIELAEQARSAMPADYANRAGNLSNLGVAYLRRSQKTKASADLDHAVDFFEQAVAAAPADSAHLCGYLANLSATYLWRFTDFGRAADEVTLHRLASQIASTTTAPPQQRLVAAGTLGRLAHAMGEHAIAVKLFDIAVEMLPLVAPRESGWADQEHRLGQDTDFVGHAVAAHCALGDPVGAVETAELGRGSLLAAQLDSRTDLTDLDAAHPPLAARFRQVRDRLNASAAGFDSPAGGSVGEIEERRRLWAEHDELLAQIREQPGFTRFQLPPRLSDLRPAAARGAVVLVNAGPYRSDAIIVTSDSEPVIVPLPDLVADDVDSQAGELLDATHDSSSISGVLRRRRVLQDVLAWLWDAIVDPVLDALPSQDGSGESTQRVWWLPVGLLGLFPLHAAGHPGQHGALDRLVSSYTPTLRALAHTRGRRPATARRQLAVALHHSPGLPDLPGTTAEAMALHADHPDTRLLVDQDVTASQVRTMLPQATWAHFACHANADLVSPSHSGLHLHDGMLSVPDISRLHLVDAELAYLSACSTAHPGLRHVDQALHLASAFHLAGYRHVVASLWPLNDHIAASAAAAFYRHLPPGPTADQAATALHDVIRELRAQHPDRPDLWAPLVHSGA